MKKLFLIFIAMLFILSSSFISAEENVTEGGFKTFGFVVEEPAPRVLGFEWKTPTNWTFPIIFFALTFILLGVAFAYESSILGVLGSIMLIFSYFLVGAASPILLTPLLIVGFLLAFKFATL